MNYLRERIGQILDQIRGRIETDSKPLEGLEIAENTGYKGLEKGWEHHSAPSGLDGMPGKDSGAWRPLGREDRFGGHYYHAWVKGKITVPAEWKDGYVELSTGGGRWGAQIITYIDGKLIQGGDGNHAEFPLPALQKGKTDYEVVFYLYVENGRHEFQPSIRLIDEASRELHYDMRVPYDVMPLVPDSGKIYADIRTHLNNAVNLLDLRQDKKSPEYKSSVKAARDYMKKEFYGKYCDVDAAEANVVCIGHTHIDVAWLWTFGQTREKAQRSFSTVINMMREFPEYKFMSSQPQLYAYVKEDAPELYEEIKKMVKEGRWECEGAMWVEADCNLTGGEGLVRQVLYGKRFFKNEFGVDSKVLWLPDVFGYSAALPQILRKSGVTRFVTSKISWNETNALPDDVFEWQGIDGTGILSFFLTAQNYQPTFSRGTTYNGTITPAQIKGAWERFQQKDITAEVIDTFGHGDGGGGPTREMVETGRRIAKGIPGVPTVSFETAGTFLDRLEKKVIGNRFLPRWVGELYLEYHRGTYTSQAANKRNNRKSEFLYMNTELLSVIANSLVGNGYPRDILREGWEKIMLCQFHDVIPGSSIREVYEDSDKIYAKIMADATASGRASLAAIASNVTATGGYLVFNPNSFTASGVAEITSGGQTVRVWADNIPAKGYKVIAKIDNVKSETKTSKITKTIENKWFEVKFDKDYHIKSIFDKTNNREVVREDEVANVLEAYEDYPRAWDAWEVTNYYTEKKWIVDDIQSVEHISEGPRAGFEITRKFQKSVIKQKIWLYDNVAKIDFETDIDWENDHILLKAAFPTDIKADKATYDIQYGSVERPTHYNTSWDQAKFEVCAHKYGDLSDYGYGVSLLNDCKYGYDIHDGTLRLTLLKSATSPDPKADKCHHKFTYTLYPHSGDLKSGGTIKQAYLLNNPLYGVEVGAQSGKLPPVYSFVTADKDNIYIEAVKPAEDSDDVIVRLYDAHNMTTTTKLTFGFPVKKAAITDMLENEQENLKVEGGNSVSVKVKPFEIVTVKLTKQIIG